MVPQHIYNRLPQEYSKQPCTFSVPAEWRGQFAMNLGGVGLNEKMEHNLIPYTAGFSIYQGDIVQA